MPDGAEKKGQARGESVRGIRFAYWGAAGVTEPLKPRRPDKAEPPSGNGVCMWLWWNDSVHQALGSFINPLCGERDKGSGRAPLVNPRGPARKSVLRTALTSREPDCGRLDSTSCLGSPLSAIHGVQTLSFTLRFADFSGDTTPRCEILGKSNIGVAVGTVW
ncbi:UNVERIFIED_ORG: hypothetical protein J2S99_003627 [Atlantibacter hermannii]|jgi:hypothetical protein|nr:hypothetical protein [Atlantibacter hermannii]